MVSGSTTLGDEERRIVEDVFAAGDAASAVMVRRTEVDFLPGDMPVPCRARADQGAALALSGDGVPRRHHRLRSCSRSARS